MLIRQSSVYFLGRVLIIINIIRFSFKFIKFIPYGQFDVKLFAFYTIFFYEVLFSCFIHKIYPKIGELVFSSVRVQIALSFTIILSTIIHIYCF